MTIQVELRQIYQRVVSDLQLLESGVAIIGQKVRQSLVKGDAPAVIFTVSPEGAHRLFDFFFRAYRIAKGDRKIGPDAVGNEAITCGIEEVCLVRPKFEVIQ